LASEYGDEYRSLQAKQNELFTQKKALSIQLAKTDDASISKQIYRLDSIEKTHRLESKFLIKKAIDKDYVTEYNTLKKEVETLSINTEVKIYSKKSDELEQLKKHKSFDNQYKTLKKEVDILKSKPKVIDFINVSSKLSKLYKSSAKDTQTNDRDYMFIRFILNQLPTGLIGLLLAVILSAAMSSTASEINALATITSIDLYGRNIKGKKDDASMVRITKWFTLIWGIVAIRIACFANLAENLIQLVNIIGSIFYGNVLGIFLLAFFFKHIKGNAVFTGALITQVIIIIGWWFDWMPYLWLNLFGCVLVMAITHIIYVISALKKS